MDKIKKIPLGDWLYLLIFIFAFGFRLVGVNDVPLTDWDATHAISAVDFSQGNLTSIGSQPAYVILTGILFSIFRMTNFWARVIPAVGGACLVFLPLFFRGKLEKGTGLVWSILIAVSPALMASARWDAGTTLGVTGLLFSFGFFVLGKYAAAGVMFALTLLSGESFWLGLLGLILTGWLTGIIFPKKGKSEENGLISFINNPGRLNWIKTGLWGLGSYILIGSTFFTHPLGLAGIASSFEGVIQKITQPGGVSVIRQLIALVSSEPLLVLLGIIGIIQGFIQKQKNYKRLAVWLLVALILAILPAGRQVVDLSYAIIPLSMLASLAINNIIGKETEPTLVWIQAIIMVILTVIIAFNLVGLYNSNVELLQNQQRFIQMVSSGILLIFIIGLVWWGWSGRTALKGFVIGAVIILGIMTISGGIRALGFGNHPEANIWLKSGYPQDQKIITQTISDISEWTTGNRFRVDGAIVGIPSSNLRWSLDPFNQIKHLNSLSVESHPSIVLSGSQENLTLGSSYRGQDFILSSIPLWNDLTIHQWMEWLILQKIPTEQETIIIWVRNDIMPGINQ